MNGHMKKNVTSMALAFVCCAGPLYATVNIGDTRAQVEAALGAPTGWIVSGEYELLTYRLGRVELKSGIVSACEIVSPEVAEQRQRDKLLEMEQRRLLAAERREKRIVVGTALKERMLSDSVFMASSAESQTRYWAQFKQRYPEVPADLEYQGALAQYRREQDALASERAQRIAAQRLEDAERRVDAAEQRVVQAERRAERLVRYRSRQLFTFSSCPTACTTIGQPGSRVVNSSSRSGIVLSGSGLLHGSRQDFRQLGFTGHRYTRTALVSSPLLSISFRK